MNMRATEWVSAGLAKGKEKRGSISVNENVGLRFKSTYTERKYVHEI